MCNCKKTEGFSEKLRTANALTQTTGELHVVFVLKPLKAVFVCKEADLNDDMGICCYFTPDGTEVIYTPKTNNIPVVDAETIGSKDEVFETIIGKVKKVTKKQ